MVTNAIISLDLTLELTLPLSTVYHILGYNPIDLASAASDRFSTYVLGSSIISLVFVIPQLL